jgi:hypothetical protein
MLGGGFFYLTKRGTGWFRNQAAIFPSYARFKGSISIFFSEALLS